MKGQKKSTLSPSGNNGWCLGGTSRVKVQSLMRVRRLFMIRIERHKLSKGNINHQNAIEIKNFIKIREI